MFFINEKKEKEKKKIKIIKRNFCFSECDNASPNKDSSGTLCYKDRSKNEITKDVDCENLGCCFDKKNSKCWVPRGINTSQTLLTFVLL